MTDSLIAAKQFTHLVMYTTCIDIDSWMNEMSDTPFKRPFDWVFLPQGNVLVCMFVHILHDEFWEWQGTYIFCF